MTALRLLTCSHDLFAVRIAGGAEASAIGFLRAGEPLCFVCDITDFWKLDAVASEAFRLAPQARTGALRMAPEQAVRLACRDAFRKSGLIGKTVPGIQESLVPGELPGPDPAPEAQGPALDKETIGDADHRGGQCARRPAWPAGCLVSGIP